MFMWPTSKVSAGRAGWRRWLAAASLLVLIAGITWFFVQPREPMPDFREYVAGAERKAAFFEFVRPLIRAENDRLREDRKRLQAIVAEADPGFFDRRWLAELAEQYGIDEPGLDDLALAERLLVHVDVVPMSLALAQAAKESGWGTSRFARHGYNLFGEWCFEEGCGMVPRARSEGRSHEVESFRSPRESVASYLNNINTHPQYQAFREARARQRAEDSRLSGVVLAAELGQYSERRDAYVKEIVQLIRSNELEAQHGNGSP
jgi:Bax protein